MFSNIGISGGIEAEAINQQDKAVSFIPFNHPAPDEVGPAGPYSLNRPLEVGGSIGIV